MSRKLPNVVRPDAPRKARPAVAYGLVTMMMILVLKLGICTWSRHKQVNSRHKVRDQVRKIPGNMKQEQDDSINT